MCVLVSGSFKKEQERERKDKRIFEIFFKSSSRKCRKQAICQNCPRARMNKGCNVPENERGDPRHILIIQYVTNIPERSFYFE